MRVTSLREEILPNDFAMHYGMVAALGHAKGSYKCMHQPGVCFGYLSENFHPFPEALFIFLRNKIFAIGELDFAKVDKFVRACNEQVDLRTSGREVVQGISWRDIQPCRHMGFHSGDAQCMFNLRKMCQANQFKSQSFPGCHLGGTEMVSPKGLFITMFSFKKFKIEQSEEIN